MQLSRRDFSKVAASLASTVFPVTSAFGKTKNIPVGLQVFTLRNELEKDVPGVLAQVSKLGYKNVEFYVPFYYTWTTAFAKDVRKSMGDLGLQCTSTHNLMDAYQPEGMGKAIELNQILGSRYLVNARRPAFPNIEGWKGLAETLNKANEKIRAAGLSAGYHTTANEWKMIDGQRPADILFKNTDKSFMHQLDVGTCVAAGADPVAWIKQNPGRIRSLHLKDWAPGKEYSVLFGEGNAPWKEIFAAAESKGGAEFYVIEQEMSDEPPLEAVKKDLARYNELRRKLS
ncbi:MAG: sugar phosphate isomerase/epimerase [Bryobacteraceae bacterium]